MRTLLFLFLASCAAPHITLDKPLTRADLEYESVYAVADAWEAAFDEVLPVKYFSVLVQYYPDEPRADGVCALYQLRQNRVHVYGVPGGTCPLDSILVHEFTHAAVHLSKLDPNPDTVGATLDKNGDGAHRTVAVWGATGGTACVKPSQCAGSIVGEALRVVRGLR